MQTAIVKQHLLQPIQSDQPNRFALRTANSPCSCGFAIQVASSAASAQPSSARTSTSADSDGQTITVNVNISSPNKTRKSHASPQKSKPAAASAISSSGAIIVTVTREMFSLLLSRCFSDGDTSTGSESPDALRSPQRSASALNCKLCFSCSVSQFVRSFSKWLARFFIWSVGCSADSCIALTSLHHFAESESSPESGRKARKRTRQDALPASTSNLQQAFLQKKQSVLKRHEELKAK